MINNNFDQPSKPAPAATPRRLYDPYVDAAPANAYAENPAVANGSATRLHFRSREPRGHLITLIPIGGIGYSQIDVYGQPTGGDVQTTDITGRAGFLAGVLTDIGSGRFTFETGAVYMQEGATLDMNGGQSSGQPFHTAMDFSLHYLGVPLVLKLNSGRPGAFRFNVKLGVIPVYATNADYTTNTTGSAAFGTHFTSTDSSSSNTGLRSMNIIAQAGAGVVIPFDSLMDFRMDVVYNRGLMPIEANDDASEKGYTQSVMGLIGLGIGL